MSSPRDQTSPANPTLGEQLKAYRIMMAARHVAAQRDACQPPVQCNAQMTSQPTTDESSQRAREEEKDVPPHPHEAPEQTAGEPKRCLQMEKQAFQLAMKKFEQTDVKPTMGQREEAAAGLSKDANASLPEEKAVHFATLASLKTCGLDELRFLKELEAAKEASRNDLARQQNPEQAAQANLDWALAASQNDLARQQNPEQAAQADLNWALAASLRSYKIQMMRQEWSTEPPPEFSQSYSHGRSSTDTLCELCRAQVCDRGNRNRCRNCAGINTGASFM